MLPVNRKLTKKYPPEGVYLPGIIQFKQWYIETRDAFEPVISERKYLMNNKHI